MVFDTADQVTSTIVPAIALLSSPQDPDGRPWTAGRLPQALAAYQAEYGRICLDPNARNIRHTEVIPAEDKRTCRVQPMLVWTLENTTTGSRE